MIDPSAVMIVIALISAAAAITGAVISAAAARRSTAHSEVVDLRNRVEQGEETNRKLWAYCRKLLDHIYRGLGPPPPPPDDLEDLFTTTKEKS